MSTSDAEHRQNERIAQAIRRVSRPAAGPDAGTAGVLLVSHDAWCAHFENGACNCEPTFEWRAIDRATLTHPAEPGQG